MKQGMAFYISGASSDHTSHQHWSLGTWRGIWSPLCTFIMRLLSHQCCPSPPDFLFVNFPFLYEPQFHITCTSINMTNFHILMSSFEIFWWTSQYTCKLITVATLLSIPRILTLGTKLPMDPPIYSSPPIIALPSTITAPQPCNPPSPMIHPPPIISP